MYLAFHSLESLSSETYAPSNKGAGGTVDIRGLVATGVQPGSYIAKLKCNGESIEDRIGVVSGDEFRLILKPRRLMIADHAKPHINVKLQSDPGRSSWWIRLSGIYNGQYYQASFARDTGDANLFDPEPGSYVVAIGSSAGYSCVQHVDLVEFTRKWVLDPTHCSFEFDRFAHTPPSSANRKEQDRWYREMDKYYQQLISEMRGIVPK
jgi:hypothetical protein